MSDQRPTASLAVTGSEAPSFRSPSGKRMYPRVRIPAEVEFNGQCYPLADISVGGFAFLNEGPPAEQGDPIRCLLHLGSRELRMTIEVTARVVRCADGRAMAVQFLDLPLHSANAIDWVVEAWLGGQSDRPPPALATPVLPAPVITGGRFDKRRLRSIALLGTGGIIIASLATLFIASTLVVRSEFAAVSAPLRVIRAPQPGVLTLTVEEPGALLNPNQKIGEIRPRAPQIGESAIDPQLNGLQTRVAALEGELADAGTSASSFRSQAQAELVAASQSRKLAERQVAAQERLYERLRGLAEQSFVSAARVDQEEVALMARRRELAEAVAAENNARMLVRQGSSGLFRADGRPTARSLSEVRRELAVARSALQRVKAAAGQFAGPAALVSPCFCTLAQVEAATGSLVAAGEPILRLAAPPADNIAEIDALIPSGRMPFLRAGQEVRVFIGGATDAVTGKIIAMNYNAQGAGRTGLPDNLRTARAYGLVTVAVAQSDSTRQTGVPAIVEVPIEIGTLLRNIPGMSWLMGSSTPSQLA